MVKNAISWIIILAISATLITGGIINALWYHEDPLAILLIGVLIGTCLMIITAGGFYFLDINGRITTKMSLLLFSLGLFSLTCVHGLNFKEMPVLIVEKKNKENFNYYLITKKIILPPFTKVKGVKRNIEIDSIVRIPFKKAIVEWKIKAKGELTNPNVLVFIAEFGSFEKWQQEVKMKVESEIQRYLVTHCWYWNFLPYQLEIPVNEISIEQLGYQLKKVIIFHSQIIIPK